MAHDTSASCIITRQPRSHSVDRTNTLVCFCLFSPLISYLTFLSYVQRPVFAPPHRFDIHRLYNLYHQYLPQHYTLSLIFPRFPLRHGFRCFSFCPSLAFVVIISEVYRHDRPFLAMHMIAIAISSSLVCRCACCVAEGGVHSYCSWAGTRRLWNSRLYDARVIRQRAQLAKYWLRNG